jgi:hypothetical protein
MTAPTGRSGLSRMLCMGSSLNSKTVARGYNVLRTRYDADNEIKKAIYLWREGEID